MNRVVDFIKKFKEFFSWKYMFYMFKTFGMAPINLDSEALQNTNKKMYKFSHSFKNIAYNFFILIVITISNCLAAYGYFYKEQRGNEYIYYTSDIVVIFSTTCIVMIFGIKCMQQINIYNKIIQIRDSVNEDWNDPRSNLYRKIHVVFVIHILVYLSMAISDYSQNNFHLAIYCLHLNVCHIIITLVAIQYWIIVEIMKQLYTSLNAKLSHYWKHINFADQFTSAVEIGDKLSRFWQLYAELNKASRDISSFYSIGIMLFIINALLVSISVIYGIIAKPMAIENWNMTTYDYTGGFFLIMPYLYCIILLTSSVTATVDESKKTREIVNGLLRKSQSRIIRENLYKFSITLLYDVVEFTVFDFFSLNGSLVVSIVGSVTTYLVLLLQFQSKKCTDQD